MSMVSSELAPEGWHCAIARGVGMDARHSASRPPTPNTSHFYSIHGWIYVEYKVVILRTDQRHHLPDGRIGQT